MYGTFLGGEGDDVGHALELDGRGGVLLGGTTTSGDFTGQSRADGQSADAFISFQRLSSASSLASIVFGGSAEEKLTGIAVDRLGRRCTTSPKPNQVHPLVSACDADPDLVRFVQREFRSLADPDLAP